MTSTTTSLIIEMYIYIFQAYANIGWYILNNNEKDMLIVASESEIINKLKGTTNTFQRNDKIEYIQLKLLDSKVLLLEIIFEAVHRIGIPLWWKISNSNYSYTQKISN